MKNEPSLLHRLIALFPCGQDLRLIVVTISLINTSKHSLSWQVQPTRIGYYLYCTYEEYQAASP